MGARDLLTDLEHLTGPWGATLVKETEEPAEMRAGDVDLASTTYIQEYRDTDGGNTNSAGVGVGTVDNVNTDEEVTEESSGFVDVSPATTTHYQFRCNNSHAPKSGVFFGPMRSTKDEAVRDMENHQAQWPTHSEMDVETINN